MEFREVLGFYSLHKLQHAFVGQSYQLRLIGYGALLIQQTRSRLVNSKDLPLIVLLDEFQRERDRAPVFGLDRTVQFAATALDRPGPPGCIFILI